MSLRTFHIVFIICSILLTIGFGYWAMRIYFDQQVAGYLWTSLGSFALAIGLIIYEMAFLKKINP